MSYIKHRDRVFQRKGRNAIRKRSDCNLRKISSCGDVRAWSIRDDDRRQFFIDSVTTKSSSSNFGKFVPPDVIVDILKKQNYVQFKKFNSLKKCSSEDLLKKRRASDSKMTRSDDNCPDIKSSGDVEKSREEEINNLREMVKDLESKLLALECLRDENQHLKSQICGGNEKIEIINPVNSSLVRFTHQSNLTNSIDLMKIQCSDMRSSVDYLQSKNTKLINKLKKISSSELALRNQQLSVSLETVNNAILKSKVDSKNMKIEKLLTKTEEQKNYINRLVRSVNELTMKFSWKEEMLMGKLLDFKNLVDSCYEKSIRYEKQLTLCHEVIGEMERLSNNFRAINATLKEDSRFYQARVNFIAQKAVDMSAKIEFLLREVAKRDAKIKELSKFPGRAAMAVRLVQLDKIVQEEFLFDTSGQGVIQTFDKLKSLVKDLKRDTWDSYGFERPNDFCDNDSQTSIEQNDSCIEVKPYVIHSEIQTTHPDSYIIQFILYICCKSVFNIALKQKTLKLKSRELEVYDLNSRCAELQQTIFKKDSELETLSNHNILLVDEIKTLNKIINTGRSEVIHLTEVNNCEVTVYDCMIDLFVQDIRITVNEYEDYCKILHFNLIKNQEQFDDFIYQSGLELSNCKWQHASDIFNLEMKCDSLDLLLSGEKELNSLLLNELRTLRSDLADREEFIDETRHYLFEILSENRELYRLLNMRKDTSEVCSQIEMNCVNTEVMTDYSYSISSVDVMVEACIQHRHSINRKRSSKHNLRDNSLKHKLSHVNVRVKRIRMKVINLKNKLELAVGTLNKLKESNERLTDFNSEIVRENHAVKVRNKVLQGVALQLKNCARRQLSENKEKSIFFQDFRKMHSELLDLKKAASKRVTEISTGTDITMNEFDILLESKDECINQLKERIEKLLDLLRIIEEEKKIRENNIVSSYSQSDLDESMEEKYEKMICDVKDNYENIISSIKKNVLEENEKKEKYYRNNLSMLKDTYERDIRRIKVANADSLRKIQKFHEDEIKTIKMSIGETRSTTDLFDSSMVRDKHALEIQNLRDTYENMIKEKTGEFHREKQKLQDELKKYMSEKEEKVEEITRKMEMGMKNLKKKCKQYVKKLKSEKCYTLKDIHEQYNRCRTDETSSLDMSDGYSITMDQDYCGGASDMADGDDTDTFFEAKTDSSGFDEESYGCVSSDERRFFIKRIQLLEEELAHKKNKTLENACDSEKRIWIERERCREVSKRLDAEIERNEKLKNKLREEKSKCEQLALANQTLMNQLHKMDTHSYMHVDKEVITSYNDLFDSFNTIQY